MANVSKEIFITKDNAPITVEIESVLERVDTLRQRGGEAKIKLQQKWI
jgi:hypothetical protein